jgi:methionyl-tRNA formyltransferase
VKVAAEKAGIPLRQYASLKTPDALKSLRADVPDVVVVAAFGTLLSQTLLDVPPLGCVNLHASLLPRWRGAAPIQRAVLAHDETTGVSIMRMEAGLDTGPWCAQASVPLDDKYLADLTAQLAEVGARLMSEVLPDLAAGTATWHEQDGLLATYASKVTAADVALDPGLALRDALARVRAASPSAPCRATLAGRRVTVLRATASARAVAPGSALCDGTLDLGCVDGALRVESLVPEGRSAMAADAFLRGARLPSPCKWGLS